MPVSHHADSRENGSFHIVEPNQSALEPAMTEKRNREELLAKRNQLFWRFLNNPKETALAIEIKLLDDRVAEITQRMVEQERNAVPSEKKGA
jgi:hypothetical protein